jgi:hypothetical protein
MRLRSRGSASRRFNGLGRFPPLPAALHVVATNRPKELQPLSARCELALLLSRQSNEQSLPAEIIYGSPIEIRLRAKPARRRCVQGSAVSGETGG